MTRRVHLVFCVLIAAACSRDPAPPAAESPGRAARTLTIPGATAAAEEHVSTLVWEVPRNWKEEPPSSSMRRAQYRVPGSAGAGECVVFYFGPGQGGDAASNAARWANQFEQPDGRPSTAVMRQVELEGTQVSVQLVEVTGTYNGGMTMTDVPATPMPGWMLLGGVAQGPDAPWFFKLTGPEATLGAEREAFLGLLRSVRTGPS